MSQYPQLLESMLHSILTQDARDTPQLSGHLAVYTQGYVLRLSEVLGNSFPALKSYLGGAAFESLAHAYIAATPSRHFNIDQYPLGFAAYVAGQGDIFAGELAELEETIHDIYRRPESPPLTTQWLARQSPESLPDTPFTLRTASRLLRFTYPVGDYLTASREGAHPAKPAPSESYLCILRHLHQVRRLPLDEAQYQLLFALASGKTLAQALEAQAFAPYIEQASHLSQWLADWITQGILKEPV